MGKTIDKQLDNYVTTLLEGAGTKPKEIAKLSIIYKAYYNEIKASLDKDKVTLMSRKLIIGSLIRFVVEFETICVKSYSPISGSGSTSDDIISMFSRREINNQLSTK